MTFVRNLIVQIAKLGYECTVIAPQSVTRQLKQGYCSRPYKWLDIEDDARITVYQPKYFSFSNYFPKLNDRLFERAVFRSFNHVKTDIDVLYAHFWHLGAVASKIKCTIPLIVACGESEIIVQNRYSSKELDVMKNKVKGVIYVSSKCYEESRALGLQETCPYIIAPNGFSSKRFHKKSKQEVRTRLNIPQDVVVGIFVGAFNERKGVLRTQQAALKIKNLKMIYIGRGEDIPVGNNIIYIGPVNNDELVDYLCASDFFVLPTRAEGCCNAIVEALACGLPVISSNRNFNKDILNESNAIMIEPDDEKEILEAIKLIKENRELRECLALGASEKSKELSIEKRALKITRFIEEIYETCIK